MEYVDLHIHTIYSDGLDSPEQVVKVAGHNANDPQKDGGMKMR